MQNCKLFRTRGNFSQDDDDGSGNSGDEREEMDLDKEDDVESTITSPQNESASSVSEGTKPNVCFSLFCGALQCLT